MPTAALSAPTQTTGSSAALAFSKPSAVTTTAGAVFTPTFIPGLNVTVDYYNLDLRGAVGVIQPIAAITMPNTGALIMPV